MADKINWKILDGSDLIMGRLCSQVAKLVLLGEHVLITNAKDVVISGRRNEILEKYVHLRHIRNLSNPRRGPFHSSRPDTFLRQKVKAMLPKNARGHEALKRLHVYITAIPVVKAEKYANQEPIVFANASAERLRSKYITVEDVCNNMGWTRKRGPGQSA
ncbi:50S ribosomal protein L13 [Candidatus Lokiarchaeum ossiferum]|uniref:Large ribosomal subunit protein uL13 n=1 Tax=Candidatus Lokiarchaeum ossiferum TaxID=2951803 RepID=A0ABY6HZ83_9ARCH|nr:50S ribosomal protein L13 [Candidatus Lokiarchaeum sp. B-35]